MKSIGILALKARKLKDTIYILYLSSKDPRVPLYVKILILMIIAYALSPVDLIPDFIPLLGYVDDLIILPLGIYLVLKLIPEEVKAEYREKVGAQLSGSNLKWAGLVMIVVVWLLIVFWIVAVFWL
jgi:uncharacterized membrane protein YkvA (DUF1232 family)